MKKTLANYHTHTYWCDGVNSPAELCEAAISKGFDILGFSGHSWQFYDGTYEMTPCGAEKYRREVREVAEKYAGRLKLYCGVEQDSYSLESTAPYDFVIGSVHNLRVPTSELLKRAGFAVTDGAGFSAADGTGFAVTDRTGIAGDFSELYDGAEYGIRGLTPEARHYLKYEIESGPGGIKCCEDGYTYASVEYTPELLALARDRLFGGDIYALIACYFQGAAEVVHRTNCDIVGHFDIIKKFNERCGFFDEEDTRYRRAVLGALGKLIPEKRVFEVNTAAMARGYCGEPYPGSFILKELARADAKIILSSDCHEKKYLDYGFSEARELAFKCGIKEENILRELPMQR